MVPQGPVGWWCFFLAEDGDGAFFMAHVAGSVFEFRHPDVGALREALAAREIPFESVHPVHRLDRTTEGLMLFALNRRAAGILSRAMADGHLRNIYCAYLTADGALRYWKERVRRIS